MAQYSIDWTTYIPVPACNSANPAHCSHIEFAPLSLNHCHHRSQQSLKDFIGIQEDGIARVLPCKDGGDLIG